MGVPAASAALQREAPGPGPENVPERQQDTCIVANAVARFGRSLDVKASARGALFKGAQWALVAEWAGEAGLGQRYVAWRFTASSYSACVMRPRQRSA